MKIVIQITYCSLPLENQNILVFRFPLKNDFFYFQAHALTWPKFIYFMKPSIFNEIHWIFTGDIGRYWDGA